MSPTAAFMPKFFVISGAILVLSGLAQALVRPRKPGETAAQRILNGSILRAVMFVTVGILGILFGLGVLPLAHFPHLP